MGMYVNSSSNLRLVYLLFRCHHTHNPHTCPLVLTGGVGMRLCCHRTPAIVVSNQTSATHQPENLAPHYPPYINSCCSQLYRWLEHMVRYRTLFHALKAPCNKKWLSQSTRTLTSTAKGGEPFTAVGKQTNSSWSSAMVHWYSKVWGRDEQDHTCTTRHTNIWGPFGEADGHWRFQDYFSIGGQQNASHGHISFDVDQRVWWRLQVRDRILNYC